jgi:pre-rRNA-processing protein TSR4
MRFLLQIYCPADDVEPSAFHRSIYLFICPKATCVDLGRLVSNSVAPVLQSHEVSGRSPAHSLCIFYCSCVALRCQLPKQNKYYPFDPDAPSSNSPDLQAILPNRCNVCSFKGPLTCAACKCAHYCSKQHQKLDWKQHKLICLHKQKSAAAEAKPLPVVATYTFPEFGIVISDEVEGEAEDVHRAADAMKNANVWDDAVTEGGEDEKEDLALKQSDYDQCLGNDSHDTHYKRFLRRIERGGSGQILRYYRASDDPNSHHLAVSEADYQKIRCHNFIENCPHCGGERQLEFQVMPQILWYLQTDKRTVVAREDDGAAHAPTDVESIFLNKANADLNFGAIDVYCCRRSCPLTHGSGYCMEFVHIQPLAVSGKTRQNGISETAGLSIEAR